MSTAFYETTEAPVNPATYGDIPLINSNLFTLFGTHDGSDFPEEFLIPLERNTAYTFMLSGLFGKGGTAAGGYVSLSLVNVDQNFDFSASANDDSLLVDPVTHILNRPDRGEGTNTATWSFSSSTITFDGVALAQVYTQDADNFLRVKIFATDQTGFNQSLTAPGAGIPLTYSFEFAERSQDDFIGNDLLQGDAQDNVLRGLRHDDFIDGGGGTDTAEYMGNSDHFNIVFDARTLIQVSDRIDDFEGEGTDQLLDMELVQFGDGRVVALNIFDGGTALSEAEFRSFTEMYIAYFNRAPDSEGLLFWADAFAGGTSMPEIAEYFAISPEALAAFPAGSSNANFVSTVYDNVLGRQPDAAGEAFWNQVLDNGAVSRSQFVLEILKGARAAPGPNADPAFVTQQQADQKFLDDKVDIGLHFSAWLGMSDVANATDVMNLFDGSDASKLAARDASLDDFTVASGTDGSGELLFQLRGVFDDPFAVA